MDTLLAILFFLLPFLAVVFFLIFIDLAIRYGTGSGYELPEGSDRQGPPSVDPLPPEEMGVIVCVRRQRLQH